MEPEAGQEGVLSYPRSLLRTGDNGVFGPEAAADLLGSYFLKISDVAEAMGWPRPYRQWPFLWEQISRELGRRFFTDQVIDRVFNLKDGRIAQVRDLLQGLFSGAYQNLARLYPPQDVEAVLDPGVLTVYGSSLGNGEVEKGQNSGLLDTVSREIWNNQASRFNDFLQKEAKKYE